MISCPNCGNPATPDSSFCMSCGAEIPVQQGDISSASVVPPVQSESVPTDNRPIWERLPMTDDILLDEDLLLEEPLMPAPVVLPVIRSSSVNAFPEITSAGKPLVPFDVPPYFPPQVSPVPSNVPDSGTAPVDYELTESNPGLITRGRVEGADMTEEDLNRKPPVEEHSSLTGYSGAILSQATAERAGEITSSSDLLSRPIPPIASGKAMPVPEPVIRPVSEDVADTDEPTISEQENMPESLPAANAPLWATPSADLSEIPEDLFFESLEAELESNSQIQPAKPIFANPVPTPLSDPTAKDAWSTEPF